MLKSLYFPHDYNAIFDEGIEILIDDYGAEGYGIYWYLIEMMHREKEDGLKLESTKLNYSISKKFKIDINRVKEIIKFMIDICELFKHDEIYFWSERVLENKSKRNEISKRNSDNGKKSHKITKVEDLDWENK